MTSKVRVAILLAVAAVAGAIAGQFICASVACRNAIGLWCKREPLVAVVEGVGIYQCDLARAMAEWDNRNPDPPNESDSVQGTQIIDVIVANLRAQRLARHERVAASEINHQVELTQFQFQPRAWLTALHSNGLSSRSLRCAIAQNRRAQSWIEKKIQPAMAVPADECAVYYNGYPSAFVEPIRLRVSHIFFAAPPGSAPELIEAKQRAAQAIVDRIAHGEKFTALVVQSEDEASKKRGGDLNFFSQSRVPADFWDAVKGMTVGGPVALVRTGLGFHVVQMVDSRPPRQMSLEEARPGILVALENERRATAVKALTEDLARSGPNLQIP